MGSNTAFYRKAEIHQPPNQFHLQQSTFPNIIISLIDFPPSKITGGTGYDEDQRHRRIGGTYVQKLTEIDIKTVEALLKQGATKKGRKEIADKSAIAETSKF